MKKTKLFYPYLTDKENKRAKCSLKKTGAGVYYIYEKTGDAFKLVYIGFGGSDVKRSLYRHFQKWIDKLKIAFVEMVEYNEKLAAATELKQSEYLDLPF